MDFTMKVDENGRATISSTTLGGAETYFCQRTMLFTMAYKLTTWHVEFIPAKPPGKDASSDV